MSFPRQSRILSESGRAGRDRSNLTEKDVAVTDEAASALKMMGCSIPALYYLKIAAVFFFKQRAGFYYVEIKSLGYNSGKFEVRVPSEGSNIGLRSQGN